MYNDMQSNRAKLFEGFQTKCMVCIPPHHELRKRKGEQIKNGTFVDLPLNLLDGMKGWYSNVKSTEIFVRACICKYFAMQYY